MLVRCLSHSRAYYLTRWLEDRGVPAISPHRTVATCGDKMLTSAALQAAGLPIPRTPWPSRPESALEAIEEMGYPVVLKPLLGSWGRLLARVNDRDAPRRSWSTRRRWAAMPQRLLHPGVRRQAGPGHPHLGRRRRGGLCHLPPLGALDHQHGTGRRGRALSPLARTIVELSLAAAQAVGVDAGQPGIVAVDLLETADGRLLVNEVNHTPEFHGAVQATDADIAGRIVDYVRVAEARSASQSWITYKEQRRRT